MPGWRNMGRKGRDHKRLYRDILEEMPTAYIGMGANLASWAGPPEATLAAAAHRLGSLGEVACRSSLYSTDPVGFAAQPRFVNAVVELETGLAPRQLLVGLLNIEQEFGRDRSAGFQNGPRSLDLDLLLYDDLVLDEPDLQIPHPRIAERAFVLVPLAEIAPHKGDTSHQGTMSQWLKIARKCARSDSNAVVSIQSDVWRRGASGRGA